MPQRHEEYYFEFGDVIFLIGDVLFKVPLYRLQWSESSVFRTLFSLPPVSAHEGKADGTPVTLNVLLEEFEALMRILYGPLLEEPRQIPMKTYRLAMRIAKRYSMDDVQEAITRVVKGSLSTGPHHTAINRFVLISEHSTPFSDDEVMNEFKWICELPAHPNEDELRSFDPYWELVSCVMEGRAYKGQFIGRSNVFTIPPHLRSRALSAVRRHE